MKAILSIALPLLVWFWEEAPSPPPVELRREATVDLVVSSNPRPHPGPSHGETTPAILLSEKGENDGKKPQHGILTARFQLSAPLPQTSAHISRAVVADVPLAPQATPLRC